MCIDLALFVLQGAPCSPTSSAASVRHSATGSARTHTHARTHLVDDVPEGVTGSARQRHVCAHAYAHVYTHVYAHSFCVRLAGARLAVPCLYTSLYTSLYTQARHTCLCMSTHMCRHESEVSLSQAHIRTGDEHTASHVSHGVWVVQRCVAPIRWVYDL